MRRFELVEGKSAKFWEVSVAGATVSTHWGRIGAAAGQRQEKKLATPDAANAQAEKQIREKLAKGYREAGPSKKSRAAATPKTAPAPKPRSPSRQPDDGKCLFVMQGNEEELAALPANAKWRALRQSLEIPSGQLAVFDAVWGAADKRLKKSAVLKLAPGRYAVDELQSRIGGSELWIVRLSPASR